MDKNDLQPCAVCNRKVPTSLEPSRGVLLFGPFPPMHVTYERRCVQCERKSMKEISRALAGLAR